MKFGHFDDKAREYVIDTPRTPYPWINYLGCEKFFGIISNTAGGYCFYREAGISTSMTTALSGIPDGSLSRRSWTNTPAATAWVIRSSPAKRTA